jgi:hypothetical protein
MNTLNKENTEGAIIKAQSRETGNIEYTRQRQIKNTTQYVLDTTMRKQTNNVNKI